MLIITTVENRRCNFSLWVSQQLHEFFPSLWKLRHVRSTVRWWCCANLVWKAPSICKHGVSMRMHRWRRVAPQHSARIVGINQNLHRHKARKFAQQTKRRPYLNKPYPLATFLHWLPATWHATLQCTSPAPPCHRQCNMPGQPASANASSQCLQIRMKIQEEMTSTSISSSSPGFKRHSLGETLEIKITICVLVNKPNPHWDGGKTCP